MVTRRLVLLGLLAANTAPTQAASAIAPADTSRSRLVFPADFGSHPASRIEWWYITGALESGQRLWGFQITFFRAATGIGGAADSRFQASQLLFAHAAVTDLEGSRLRHDQRIARSGFGIAEASTHDTATALHDWRLVRESTDRGSLYRAHASSETAGFGFDLTLQATQPVLIQGLDGVSQKGPLSAQSSRYYSEPQLAASGTLVLDRGPEVAVTGRAWLDHEWSDSLLDASAVGWDWIGMNLDDGAALTAFRLRRADGSMLWAGGSFRPKGGETRNFAPHEVDFDPGRRWTSPASKASYPVRWHVTTPAGRFTVDAMQDDQELASLASTGSIYWEGLSRLLDSNGRALGRGYLEMTGYAAPLVL